MDDLKDWMETWMEADVRQVVLTLQTARLQDDERRAAVLTLASAALIPVGLTWVLWGVPAHPTILPLLVGVVVGCGAIEVSLLALAAARFRVMRTERVAVVQPVTDLLIRRIDLLEHRMWTLRGPPAIAFVAVVCVVVVALAAWTLTLVGYNPILLLLAITGPATMLGAYGLSWWYARHLPAEIAATRALLADLQST